MIFLSKNNILTLRNSILGFLLLSLLLNYYFRQALYELGLNLIFQMQHNPSTFTTGFYNIISFIYQPIFLIPLVSSIILVEKNKEHSYNVLTFLLFHIYLINILKSFYNDPQPFWTNHQLKSLTPYCLGEYGNPSAHSQLSSDYWPNKWNRHIGFIFCLFVIIFVSISGMYLGFSSLNQVLQGLSLGLCMSCLYHFCGFKLIIKNFLQEFNSEPKLGWKKYIAFFHLTYIFSYFMNRTYLQSEPDRQIWQINITENCRGQFQVDRLNFIMLLVNSTLVNFVSGFSMGYDNMSASDKGRKYLDGRWEVNQQRYSYKHCVFLYYLIQIASLGSGFLCAYILSLTVDNDFFLFLVVNAGAGLSGYLYSAKHCRLLYQYLVIKERL